MKINAAVCIDLDGNQQVRVEAWTDNIAPGDLPGAAAALCDATRGAALDAWEQARQQRGDVPSAIPTGGQDMRTFGDED